MAKKKNPMTRDHIVARELWWSDNPKNIRLYPERKHNARHLYFGNKLIHQEICQLLDEASTAITVEFAMRIKQELFACLQEWIVYDEDVWRKTIDTENKSLYWQ